MGIEKRKKATDSSLPTLRTDHFSFKVTPYARFVGALGARVTGMNFTTFIERAVVAAAESVKIGDVPVASFWDENVGVSWCLIYLEGKLPLDSQEAATKEFVMTHKRFFYVKKGNKIAPNKVNINVLWPSIEHYVDDWQRRRTVDAWATGEKLQDALKSARVAPPAWGPKVDPDEV